MKTWNNYRAKYELFHWLTIIADTDRLPCPLMDSTIGLFLFYMIFFTYKTASFKKAQGVKAFALRIYFY